MSSELLKKLSSIMEIVNYPSKTVILREGQYSNHIYIILSGTVSIYVKDRLIYNLNQRGDIFGEISFINKVPCTADVVAQEDVALWSISRSLLDDIGSGGTFEWVCRILIEKLNRMSQSESLKTTVKKDTPKKIDQDQKELDYDFDLTLFKQPQDRGK